MTYPLAHFFPLLSPKKVDTGIVSRTYGKWFAKWIFKTQPTMFVSGILDSSTVSSRKGRFRSRKTACAAMKTQGVWRTSGMRWTHVLTYVKAILGQARTTTAAFLLPSISKSSDTLSSHNTHLGIKEQIAQEHTV